MGIKNGLSSASPMFDRPSRVSRRTMSTPDVGSKTGRFVQTLNEPKDTGQRDRRVIGQITCETDLGPKHKEALDDIALIFHIRKWVRPHGRTRNHYAQGRAAPALASKLSIEAAFSRVKPMSSKPFNRQCLRNGSMSNLIASPSDDVIV